MNNLCFAVPCSIPLELAGREYEVGPLLLRDLASAELYLRRERGEPAVLAGHGAAFLTDQRLAKLLMQWGDADQRAARANPVTLDDLLRWLESSPGMAFAAWRSLLRRERRAFEGPAAARKFIHRLGERDARRLMETILAASALDQPAMLEWHRPAHVRAPARATPAASPGKSRGGVPWRQFLRKAALDFGWTPEQLGTLTYWQVWVYVVEESELGGVQRVSAAAGLAMAAKARRAAGESAGAGAAPQPAADTRVMHPARQRAMAQLAKEKEERKHARRR